MSQTAQRPWWADVQHLRPDEGGDTATPQRGRFDRDRSRVASPRPTSSRVASRAAASDAPRPEPREVERRERPEPESWLDEVPTPTPAEPKQRRTIEIRGQVDRVHGVAPVPSPGPQRIRGRRADERVGPRPDKVAMWAVLLGILLILVALMSGSNADAAAIAAGWL